MLLHAPPPRDAVLAVLLKQSVTDGYLTVDEVRTQYGESVASILHGLQRVQQLYSPRRVAFFISGHAAARGQMHMGKLLGAFRGVHGALRCMAGVMRAKHCRRHIKNITAHWVSLLCRQHKPATTDIVQWYSNLATCPSHRRRATPHLPDNRAPCTHP